MYLSRLIIKNYRSIENVDITFNKGKNIIVGRNNAGKSNLIKAIDIVLGESSPTYNKFENITISDFFSWKEKDTSGKEIVKHSNCIEIICKLTREENENLNFTEIDNCMGYYKVLQQKPTFGDANSDVNLTFNLGENFENNVDKIFKLNKDESDSSSESHVAYKRWVDSKLNNQRRFKDELSGHFEFAFIFRATIDEIDGTIKKDIRFIYRENEAEEWVLGLTAPVRNELLQSAIVSSFRDPQNQLRLANYTWYGKLMRALTSNHSYADDLKKAHDQIKKVADNIFNTAKTNIQSSSLDVAFPNAEIFFQFNEDVKTDIYKDCKIYIDDGVKSPLSEKGSGIQSATIIGLFSYYINNFCSKTGALLCVEEPELYLHPHSRRVISDRLDDFLDGDKNQVIITTHSSEFIKTTKEDLNIILVKSIDHKTTAKSIDVKDYKYLLIDNNQNEIFFSDKVILCEGYDEYILRWVSKLKFGNKLDEENISIILSGGKDGLTKLSELVVKLGIKSYLFSDFDFLLRDQEEQADKYKEIDPKTGKTIKTFRHQSVVNLPKMFFEQNHIFGDKADEKLKAIRELRNKIKTSEEKFFYTGKTIEESLNKTDIEKILNDLRNSSVCILDGDIETLSLNEDLLSLNNKLNLKKVFEINKVMSETNTTIDSIIKTETIENFLNKVFTT